MSNNFQERNKNIRKHCEMLERRYPHWEWDEYLRRTAKKYFLSPRTIKAIVKGEGIYSY